MSHPTTYAVDFDGTLCENAYPEIGAPNLPLIDKLISRRRLGAKGNWNNYRTSNVRGVLSDMANAVFGGKGLLAHTVDLVADNGDRAYGAVQDFVFILTCDEYRKYRDYIPHYDNWIWTATPWYCGDKDSDTGAAINVRFVDTDGQLDIAYAYFSHAVAPACILNPAHLNLRQSIAFVEEVSE